MLNGVKGYRNKPKEVKEEGLLQTAQYRDKIDSELAAARQSVPLAVSKGCRLMLIQW
ncbi:hypothetical protein FACS1894200_04860 [Spirochaetia bacterium]|nr:hypothetical protein FACS1894200_04860 [Spirochaetia bacterium]